MSEAFIYDAIRTPRGIGKREGALYEVKPITLVTALLAALAERNQIDPARVDDIIMGGQRGAGRPGGMSATVAAGPCWWALCLTSWRDGLFDMV